MSLDKEKIKHVAKLARISVDEAKVDSLTKDLNSIFKFIEQLNELNTCLLYTSPSPRDRQKSRMPSSA